MASSSPPAGPDLHDHVSLLWRRKWVILACLVVAVAASLAYSLSRTPMYRASSEVAINGTLNISGVLERPWTVAGEVNLARSAAVRAVVREEVGGAGLSVAGNDNAASLTFTATSSDPEVAAAAANAYAEAFMVQRRALRLDEYETSSAVLSEQIATADAELAALTEAENAELAQAGDDIFVRGDIATSYEERRQPVEDRRQRYVNLLDSLTLSAGLAQGGGVQVLNPASVPSSPYTPDTQRNVALAIVLGLIAGVGLAYLLQYLDTKLRDDVDLVEATGLPTLTVVPLYGEQKRGRKAKRQGAWGEVASLTHPRSELSEAFRRLRTSVQFLGIDRPLKVVQFTSPSVGDGKTTAAANLAVTAARAGQQVILIDCDLRRPRQHEAFGLANEVGLTSVLTGEVSLVDAVQRVPGLRKLVVLPTGPIPPDPAELLVSAKMAALIESLRESADLVVLDTPPVMAVSDPLIVGALADGVLLVASVGHTDRRQLSQTMMQLSQVDAPLIGTVLNRFESRRVPGYGYGYGYGYGNDHAEPTPPEQGTPELGGDPFAGPLPTNGDHLPAETQATGPAEPPRRSRLLRR